MDYTISENIEMSAYEAVLTFNEDVRHYANNEKFNIVLYDLYTNIPKEISYQDFPTYGITNMSPNIGDRAKLSFYDHNGILMYFEESNKFYFKQLLSCKDADDNEVGFHSTNITITFDDDKEVKFNSVLLPKIVRSPNIVQIDDSEPDPVLSGTNRRPAFNYDTPFALSAMNRVSADYNAGDINGLYVNTYTPENGVPCYCSTLSAFVNTTFYTGEPVELGSVSSYLYDETTDDSYTINYSSAESAHVPFTFADGYNTDLIYYEFTQYISADDDKLHKNKLVFDMNINGTPAPEVLVPLVMTITTNHDPLRVLSKGENNDTGEMYITVTNPNFSCRELEPIVVIVDSEYTLEKTSEYDPESGTVEYKISNINFGNDIKNEPYSTSTFKLTRTIPVTVKAYLDIPEQPCTVQNTITWQYQKAPLYPVNVSVKEYTPPDGQLVVDHLSGKVIYSIINDSRNSTAGFTITEDIYSLPDDPNGITGILLSAREGGFIDDPDNPKHIVVESRSGGYNNVEIVYTNINIDTTKGESVALSFEAYIHGSNEEWKEEDVKYHTSAKCNSPNFSHNEIILQRLTIDYVSYVPAELEDGYRWLTTDRDDSVYPSAGAVTAKIHNQNTDYRDPTKLVIESTFVPRGSSADINPDFSHYSTDGDVYYVYSGISLTRNDGENETSAVLHAYLNYSNIPGYTQAEVKTQTEASATSDHWKYKIINPDIYPYNYLAGFSLYSLSDLIINGGKIGSKDIACRNLTATNMADIYSDLYLAAGCTADLNTSNRIHGTVHAQYIHINNPNTFDKAVYAVSELIITGGDTHIPSAYVASGCTVRKNEGSTIDYLLDWPNPSYPDMPGISAETITTGSESFSNGASFGSYGEYTIGNYDTLEIDNRNTNKMATFYPGKYYFNKIKTETDTTFRILNGASDDDNDKSVMIYANELELGNNISLDETSSGAFDFRLYYGGSSTATIGVQGHSNAGTIIAPFGTIKFNNAATWVGHVWAKTVYLENGASIDNSTT